MCKKVLYKNGTIFGILHCLIYGNLRFKRKKFAVALFGAIVGIAGIVGQIRTLVMTC